MAEIIISGSLFVFAAVLFVVSKLSQNSAIKFEANKSVGTAYVVGYDNASSRHSALRVKICELNDGKVYTCSYGIVKKTEYPIGKIVDVEYAVEKIMGLDFVQVRLITEKKNSDGFGKIMNKVALIFVVIAVVVL